jgi:thiamine-phosphate pyrophosphorylase
MLVNMALELYYITDRRQFPGDAQEQERRLLEKIRECAATGVDYIQLREKDLSTRALEALARKAVAALGGSRTRLLINSRTDVALASGAHGVHLPGNNLPASEVRALWMRARSAAPVIGVSAHTLAEVEYAESHGAGFAVFAPVFEKAGTRNARGLDELKQICRPGGSMPVFALGGVTLKNARLCLEAGAAGIAGIRLFQENRIDQLLASLPQLKAKPYR